MGPQRAPQATPHNLDASTAILAPLVSGNSLSTGMEPVRNVGLKVLREVEHTAPKIRERPSDWLDLCDIEHGMKAGSRGQHGLHKEARAYG